MANSKKKKKEKAGNQNVVLVIFMIFFILVSIGLGVWGYYGYAGQEELIKKRLDAEAKAKVERLNSDFMTMGWLDLRNAIGDQISADEKTTLDGLRDEFSKEGGGKFNPITAREPAKKLMDELKGTLGAQGKDYNTGLKQVNQELSDKNRALEGKLTAAVKAQTYYETLAQELQKKQDEFHAKALKNIDVGNTQALAEAKKRSDDFKALEKNGADLKLELKGMEEKMEDLKDAHRKELKSAKDLLAKTKRDMADLAASDTGGGGGAVVKNTNDLFPLLLDISKGTTLWDNAVGKVIRVDPDWRQVAINIGSAQGAKPELTFNIFGANAYGRPEKQMKGSIEIIKVVDANTSFARITSLYDAEGREIHLNDLSRSRIVRESEAPIREGDLLFNLFWGTRVAIAGYVGVTGEASENPAEQIRQLEDFAYLLRRNGMQVDAYVDLRDGQTRGKLSAKTRYLILGKEGQYESPLTKPAPAAPKEGDDDKAKDAPKDAPKEQPGGDRLKTVQNAVDQMKKEAMNRGMLMISAENFATVIGYRRARSANSPDVSSRFNPSLPDAGVGQIGLIRNVAAPMPNEEKKAPEPKDNAEKKANDN